MSATQFKKVVTLDANSNTAFFKSEAAMLDVQVVASEFFFQI